MIERTKTIAVNLTTMALLALVLFLAITQYRQWFQYQRGERALAAGDPIQAVAGYESAIHMYTPLSPLVEKSARQIWAIGLQLEQQGQLDKALVAFRALRSSFYATHGLFRPGTDWIARCDAKISALVTLSSPPGK
jgi:tetratricopeptide (TPR) repeat protein